MRSSIALSLAAAFLARLVAAQTVEFFYTETLDFCGITDTNYIIADEQTTHGGVCAWQSNVDRIYACPAPDPTCWTWGQECTTTGIGQTICNKSGTIWCCNAVAGESCTTAQGYVNVCQSNFTSPNSGVPAYDANQVYYSAISVSTVTADTQTSDPPFFSTRELSSSPASSTASLSSVSSVSSSLASSEVSSTATGSATRTTTSALANTSSTSSNDSSAVSSTTASAALSIGTIVGIVIGAVLVLAIVSAVFFILGRRRNKPHTPYESNNNLVSPSHVVEYEIKDVKGSTAELHTNQHSSNELGDNAVTKYEMPTHNPSLWNTKAQQPHELA